jgi:hypothetical protein
VERRMKTRFRGRRGRGRSMAAYEE